MFIKIKYKTRKLESICTIYKEAKKKHGEEMAELIHKRIDQIRSADSVETLVQYRIGGCHPLKGDRDGEYAMDLKHPYRLIFIKDKIEDEIQVVKIIEIIDYH